MPPFIYFLVLLSVSLAAVIGLRLTLLRTGRHIQKHVGFSDTALTDIAVTLPLISFMIVQLSHRRTYFWPERERLLASKMTANRISGGAITTITAPAIT